MSTILRLTHKTTHIGNSLVRLVSIAMAVLAAFITFDAVASSPTPREVVQNAAARLKGAPGVKVAFTLSAGGRNMEGSLVQAGRKFAVTTPVASTWFNGTDMWSYNPRTNETTLSRPDADELRVSNPLIYLNESADKYTVKFVKNQPAGKHAVALLPNDKRSSLKSVIIVVDKNWNVNEIKVTTSDGQASVLTVRSADLNSRQAASQFEYPKIKYPRVPVVDLR